MNPWTQLLFLHGHITDPQLAADLSDDNNLKAVAQSSATQVTGHATTIEPQQRGLFAKVVAIRAAFVQQFSSAPVSLDRHDNRSEHRNQRAPNSAPPAAPANGNRLRAHNGKLSELIAAYPHSPSRKNAGRAALRVLTMFR